MIYFLPIAMVQGQNDFLDSLKNQIAITENDSLKVRLHFRVAWNSFYVDEEQALDHIRKAQSLAAQKQFERELIVADHYFGVYYRDRAQYDTAIHFFEKALSGFEAREDLWGMTAPLYNLGAVYNEMGDLENSITYYLREMAINEELEAYTSVANSCNGIGILYKQMGDFSQAMDYYNKGLATLEEHPNEETKALLLGNKANVFIEMEVWDSASYYAEQAFDIENQLERLWGIALSNQTLATIQLGQGNPSEAVPFAQEAIRLSGSLDNAKEEAEGYQLYCRILMALEKYDEAIEFCNQGMELSYSIDFQQGKQQSHQLLADLHEKLNNKEEAILNLKRYHALKDSLISDRHIDAINNLNIKYESDKKEEQIKSQELLIGQQQLRQRGLIGLSILLLLFMISLLGLLWYRRSLNQTREKSQKIEIENLKNQNKILSMDAMISGQEEERKRIARELHDGLGGILSTAKLKLQKIQLEIDELNDLKLYDQAEELIDNACEEVRRISHNMMPDALLQQGLEAAVRDLVEHMQRSTDLSVAYYTSGLIDTLPEQITFNLYRIVQELTNNVLKHANAQHLIIQITRNDPIIKITVEDDGRGFNLKESDRSGGMGLKNVRSRIDYLNGQLELRSFPQTGGTSIEIEIPLQ